MAFFFQSLIVQVISILKILIFFSTFMSTIKHMTHHSVGEVNIHDMHNLIHTAKQYTIEIQIHTNVINLN